MSDYEYDETRLSNLLPDRSDSDLPPQVRHVITLCEAAVASNRFSRERQDDPEYHFVEGVVDYWWSDHLEPPRWEQLFHKDLDTGEFRREVIPTRERFAYQQGAMVGYLLREEYKDE